MSAFSTFSEHQALTYKKKSIFTCLWKLCPWRLVHVQKKATGIKDLIPHVGLVYINAHRLFFCHLSFFPPPLLPLDDGKLLALALYYWQNNPCRLTSRSKTWFAMRLRDNGSPMILGFLVRYFFVGLWCEAIKRSMLMLLCSQMCFTAWTPQHGGPRCMVHRHNETGFLFLFLLTCQCAYVPHACYIGVSFRKNDCRKRASCHAPLCGLHHSSVFPFCGPS